MFAQLIAAVIAALTNPPMAAPFAADVANQPGVAGRRDPGRQRARNRPAALATSTPPSPAVASTTAPGCSAPRAWSASGTGQGRGVDLLLGAGMAGVPMEFGLGVILGGPEGQYGPNPRAFGHDGYGGCLRHGRSRGRHGGRPG